MDKITDLYSRHICAKGHRIGTGELVQSAHRGFLSVEIDFSFFYFLTLISHTLPNQQAVDDVGVLFQFPALFPKLRTECEERIHDKVLQLSNESQDPATFLALVDSVWRSFQEQMVRTFFKPRTLVLLDISIDTLTQKSSFSLLSLQKSVRMIFLALERKYLIPTGATGPMGASSIRTLWDLGLSIFRENLSHMAEVQEKIVSALLLHIEQERTGNMVDKILLQSLIRMFIALGVRHSQASELISFPSLSLVP